MIQTPYPGYTIPAEDVQPVYLKPGPRLFWGVFAIVGLLVVGGLALLIAFGIPSRTPLVASAEPAQVRDAVLARLNGDVLDPLITVDGGLARASNMRGFSLNKTVYYYYLDGEPGFDPLSSGQVSRNQVEIVLRDSQGSHQIVVYTIRRG